LLYIFIYRIKRVNWILSINWTSIILSIDAMFLWWTNYSNSIIITCMICVSLILYKRKNVLTSFLNKMRWYISFCDNHIFIVDLSFFIIYSFVLNCRFFCLSFLISHSSSYLFDPLSKGKKIEFLLIWDFGGTKHAQRVRAFVRRDFETMKKFANLIEFFCKWKSKVH